VKTCLWRAVGEYLSVLHKLLICMMNRGILATKPDPRAGQQTRGESRDNVGHSQT
jgi:hypothetical protein